MAEEFQESEVMFQDHVENDENQENGLMNSMEFRSCKTDRRMKDLKNVKSSGSSSLPVSIPDVNRWFPYLDSGFLDDEYGGGDEIVPPHVIVGRRVAGKVMAFSVCTGNGRTLKGRDLSQVRNSILRMTGFLET